MVFNQTNHMNSFFARTDILCLLTKRVEALKKKYRQNIAILGYHSLGKTTLIFELLKKIKHTDIIPIYIDVKPKSIETFVNNFIVVLLYQYLDLENIPLEEDFDFLYKTAKPKIPKTIQQIFAIRKLLKSRKASDEIYSMVLDLPQTLHEEAKKTLLVIFDEFHNIEHLGLKTPFLELSNKIMVQKNTMYILASSAVNLAQSILAEKLSLLFGNFELIHLKPFDTKTAGEFIDKALANIKIANLYKNFLIQFTGGYPFYLNVIIEHIKFCCLKTIKKFYNII